jgi:hypothetical protein
MKETTETEGRTKKKKQLTDNLVRELPAPVAGAAITFDTDAPGFGVRVTAAGARAYIVRYVVAGRERRFTIGDAREGRVTAARAAAKDIRARARFGEGPLAQLEQARTEPTSVTSATALSRRPSTASGPAPRSPIGPASRGPGRPRASERTSGTPRSRS